MAKLVLREPESRALMRALRDHPQRASSVVAGVELMRAVRRRRLGRRGERQAEAVLGGLVLLELTSDIVLAASRVDPPDLRTLDAIHLATARSLGDALGALVTYDRRLGSAATAEGIMVESPS